MAHIEKGVPVTCGACRATCPLCSCAPFFYVFIVEPSGVQDFHLVINCSSDQHGAAPEDVLWLNIRAEAHDMKTGYGVQEWGDRMSVQCNLKDETLHNLVLV